MSRSPAGHKPTPFQALCSACDRLFGGVTGFDAHRQGPVDARYCVDPSYLGYVETSGVWRLPMDQEKVDMFNARVDGKRGRRGSKQED